MWELGWRDRVWQELTKPWDLIIIGGGMTGAGVFRLASRAGLRTLLLEGTDFAFGTSSRSSKLVHGGMRYLRQRQFNVTYESVKERQRLLREAPHLVEPLRFNINNYAENKGYIPQFAIGMVIYDLFVPKWQHGKISAERTLEQFPNLRSQDLLSSFYYYDASTDDARLVLRLIREAVADGAVALNYARVDGLLRDRAGQVTGVQVTDRDPAGNGRTAEVCASVVINATGPWADFVRRQVGGEPRLRKLRGSHLIFPRNRLPLDHGISFIHPGDRRSMFFIPWEGTSMVGTTDLDHPSDAALLDEEPAITRAEVDYMLQAVTHFFPDLGIGEGDIRSTFAGLRPVINTGASDPSKESRKHEIFEEDGLITITGGKITTYRVMAMDVLNVARARLPGKPFFNTVTPMYKPLARRRMQTDLPLQDSLRLLARYGLDFFNADPAPEAAEWQAVDGLPLVWAELRWAARDEGVVHLDDLLLRRVRLGLLAQQGGIAFLPKIRSIVQRELGWDDARWEREEKRYRDTWHRYYYLPE